MNDQPNEPEQDGNLDAGTDGGRTHAANTSALVCSLAEQLGAALFQVAEAQGREIDARHELASEQRANRERAERGRAALSQCEAERDGLLPVVDAACQWAKNPWEASQLRNAVWAYHQQAAQKPAALPAVPPTALSNAGTETPKVSGTGSL